MPLNRDLARKMMRLRCPHCGAEIERLGTTIMAAKHLRCPNCKDTFKLGYTEKQELFERVRRSCGEGGR